MYQLLDVISDAEERAEKVVFQDRLRYLHFYEEAERFAAAKGLIIGGATATRLLLGDPADPAAPPLVALDSFEYTFYCRRAPAEARELGDAMYALDPQGLGHYTTVHTKVPEYHLAVAVDGRDLFAVIALPAHRGVNIADVVIPSYRPAQFAKGADGCPLKLPCMGPEIQLMQLYGALCNPGKSREWGELLSVEAGLRALFGREIRAKVAEATEKASHQGGRGDRRSEFFRELYNRFVAGPSRVLIGSAAVSLLRGGTPGGERIQVVTAAALEDEAQEVVALAKSLGIEVEWAAHDPKIPIDRRARRLTLSLAEGRGSRREPFMDIYNTAAYELVPYVTADALGGPGPELRRPESGGRQPWRPPAALKVGTPFVLMRFRLADMWTMQVLLRMGSLKAGYAREVLHQMLAEYEAVAAFYEHTLAAAVDDVAAAASRLLPQTAYIGRLADPDLALKREALERAGPKFYPPYLPAARAQPLEREAD